MRKWLLTFRRDDLPGGNVVLVECEEAELQGEKERIALEMERYSGAAWRCAELAPFEPKGRRRAHEVPGDG